MLVLNTGTILLVLREWQIFILNNGFLWFFYLEYSIYLGSNANTHLDYDTAPSIDLNTCCTDAKVSVCSNYTVTLIKNHPPVISSLPATGNILALKHLQVNSQNQ